MENQAQRLVKLVNEKQSNEEQFKRSNEVLVYTVTSGKGGVGKSNIVISLAIALRRFGKKILVIDADLGLANVDVLLGVHPSITLYDVMFRGKKLEDAIFEGPEGVKIIPGGSGILELSKLDIMEKKSFITQFKMISGFDIVLIDTGAGISMNQMSFITFSDEVILIGTPEPTSITDAYSVVKIISSLKLKRNLKTIINRVNSKDEGLKTFNKLNSTTSRFLGIELEYLGYVYDDKRVQSSVMAQTPFIIKSPKCLASQCVEQIANEMINSKKKLTKVRARDEIYNRLIKIFG